MPKSICYRFSINKCTANCTANYNRVAHSYISGGGSSSACSTNDTAKQCCRDCCTREFSACTCQHIRSTERAYCTATYINTFANNPQGALNHGSSSRDTTRNSSPTC